MLHRFAVYPADSPAVSVDSEPPEDGRAAQVSAKFAAAVLIRSADGGDTETAPVSKSELGGRRQQQLWAATSAIVFYGLGSFLAGFADKGGEQDLTGVMISAGVAKLGTTVCACWLLGAPGMVSHKAAGWSGFAAGVAAPLVYNLTWLFYAALYGAGADMAVVLPLSQLQMLITLFFGIVVNRERVSLALVVGTIIMLCGAILLNHEQSAAAAEPQETSQGGSQDGPSLTFVLLVLGCVLSQGFGMVLFAVCSASCPDWKIALSTTNVGYAIWLLLGLASRLVLCASGACPPFSVTAGLITMVSQFSVGVRSSFCACRVPHPEALIGADRVGTSS